MPRFDIRGNPVRLGALIRELETAHDILLTRNASDFYNLLLTWGSVLVMTNKLVGTLYYLRRTAIVGWQLKNPHPKVSLKLLKSFRARTIPLVDDLIVVSNDEEIFRVFT